MIEYTNEIEYRGYVFVNRALSSIQKGVQGAHALVELTGKPEYHSLAGSEPVGEITTLNEWRNRDKTLIFLDCGFHQEMLDHYLTAATLCEQFDLPYALFVEDEQTMNCMATAFALIAPSTIYDINMEEYERGKSYYVNGFPIKDDPKDIQFCKFLRQFPLAR